MMTMQAINCWVIVAKSLSGVHVVLANNNQYRFDSSGWYYLSSDIKPYRFQSRKKALEHLACIPSSYTREAEIVTEMVFEMLKVMDS